MTQPLEYDTRGSAEASRKRLTRLLWIVIGLKIVLVAANTAGLFANVPNVVRLFGMGLQLSLTIVFLLLLFRLTMRC